MEILFWQGSKSQVPETLHPANFKQPLLKDKSPILPGWDALGDPFAFAIWVLLVRLRKRVYSLPWLNSVN